MGSSPIRVAMEQTIVHDEFVEYGGSLGLYDVAIRQTLKLSAGDLRRVLLTLPLTLIMNLGFWIENKSSMMILPVGETPYSATNTPWLTVVAPSVDFRFACWVHGEGLPFSADAYKPKLCSGVDATTNLICFVAPYIMAHNSTILDIGT